MGDYCTSQFGALWLEGQWLDSLIALQIVKLVVVSVWETPMMDLWNNDYSYDVIKDPEESGHKKKKKSSASGTNSTPPDIDYLYAKDYRRKTDKGYYSSNSAQCDGETSDSNMSSYRQMTSAYYQHQRLKQEKKARKLEQSRDEMRRKRERLLKQSIQAQRGNSTGAVNQSKHHQDSVRRSWSPSSSDSSPLQKQATSSTMNMFLSDSHPQRPPLTRPPVALYNNENYTPKTQQECSPRRRVKYSEEASIKSEKVRTARSKDKKKKSKKHLM